MLFVEFLLRMCDVKGEVMLRLAEAVLDGFQRSHS